MFFFTSKNPKSFGEILVGLRWKKDKETLDITIQEASSLRIMDQDRRTSSESNISSHQYTKQLFNNQTTSHLLLLFFCTQF